HGGRERRWIRIPRLCAGRTASYSHCRSDCGSAGPRRVWHLILFRYEDAARLRPLLTRSAEIADGKRFEPLSKGLVSGAPAAGLEALCVFERARRAGGGVRGWELWFRVFVVV